MNTIDTFERIIFLLCGLGSITLSCGLIYFIYELQQQRNVIENRKAPFQISSMLEEAIEDEQGWRTVIQSAKSLPN